MKEDR